MQSRALAQFSLRAFNSSSQLLRAAVAETQAANLWTGHLPSRKEEEQCKTVLQPRPGVPAMPALFKSKRTGMFSFAAERLMSSKAAVEPALNPPAPKSSPVPYYVGSLIGLYVYWSLGGVDWIVTLNTGFVQAAVWITALSLVSPASVWSSLKQQSHVEDEGSVRGAQTSSAVKII